MKRVGEWEEDTTAVGKLEQGTAGEAATLPAASALRSSGVNLTATRSLRRSGFFEIGQYTFSSGFSTAATTACPPRLP